MSGRRVPAWLAVFAVVFPTIVGGGILALPVALAPLGPVLAVLVTAALGVVNALTIGLLALSVVRRADSLPPYARMGTLAHALLGRGAALVTTIVVAVLMLGLVVAYALGLSHSLATSLGLSPSLWAVAAVAGSALLVGLQLRRALMTAGTVVTITSIVLLGALMLMLVRHVDADVLLAGPPTPLAPSSFVLVFGALMGGYFGHTSVPTIAPAALRADPSGRSLIVGSVAAMAAATVVNTGWVFVTLGSTPAAAYGAAGSTGIDLVEAVAGPTAGWLALAFVLLALGVAGMISSFVLGDLAVEQLPLPRTIELDLGAGAVLHARDGATNPLVITLAARPDGSGIVAHAQRGRRLASAGVGGTGWSAATLAESVGGRRWGRWLRADVRGTQVHVRSTMLLEVDTRRASAAVRVLDPGASGRITALLLRQPRTTDELAAAAGVLVSDLLPTLSALAEEGVVERQEDGTWHVVLGHRRRIDAAGQVTAPEERTTLDMAPRSPAWLATSTAARIVATLPLCVALALVLALQVSGATFARVFSFIGISAFVLVGTTIPLLIAIASRRSADRVVLPGPLGLPVSVLWGVWVATVAVCATYAIVIYQSPGERVAAASAVVMSILCAVLARGTGAFRGSTALVMHVDPHGDVSTRLVDAGVERPITTPRHLPAPGHAFEITVDPRPTSPLRIVVLQERAPHQLVGPTATSAGQPLAGSASPTLGSGEVDLSTAESGISLTWVVG